MRRMITKNGVIDAVNEGIESGEIEVGGGLPEIEEGDAGKVLKVNEAEDGAEWGEAGGGGYTYLQEIKSSTGITTSSIKLGDVDENAITFADDTSANYFKYNLVIGTSKYSQQDKYLKLASTFRGNIVAGENFARSNLNTANYGFSTGNLMLGGIPNMHYSSVDSSILLNYRTSHNKVNATANQGIEAKNGLILGNQGTITNKSSIGKWPLDSSIILGYTDLTIESNLYTAGENQAPIYALGIGHTITIDKNYNSPTDDTPKPKGIMVVGENGKFQTSVNGTDEFIVGAGTTSVKANCFATGNDGTEDYIYIGETKVTESQLQALLALLNQ